MSEDRISDTVRVDHSCMPEGRISKTIRIDHSCVPEGRIPETVRVDLAVRYLCLVNVKHVCNMSGWIVSTDTRKGM
jgi:hypothetical protein